MLLFKKFFDWNAQSDPSIHESASSSPIWYWGPPVFYNIVF